MKSNNPPDVVLELTKEQAKFLLENCDSNITLALGLMMEVRDRSSAEMLISMNEQFKTIREKLKAQGV